MPQYRCGRSSWYYLGDCCCCCCCEGSTTNDRTRTNHNHPNKGCRRIGIVLLVLFLIISFRTLWRSLPSASYGISSSSSNGLHPPRIVLCVLAKNDHALFREFVAFHIALGIDTIELYDNGSDPPLYSVLNGLGGSRIMYHNWSDTVGNWNDPTIRNQMQGHQTLQDAAYRDCLGKYAGLPNVYAAPIDIDEFIYPCGKDGSSSSSSGITFSQAIGKKDVWALQCGKYGPSDAPPSVAGETTIERNVYRAPVMNYWTEEWDIWEALAWFTKIFHPACVDNDDSSILCEETTPVKYIYRTSRISSSLASLVWTHGFLKWPKDLENERTYTTRYTAVCCNHYFWRSTKLLLEKAERNHNKEYLARLKDQSVLAWHLTVYDPGALNYLHGMQVLLHTHPWTPG